MCGIAGLWNFNRSSSEHESCAIVVKMADRLAHRGPDDSGAWSDPAAGIALGHRRLSILDLSPSGHQPMHSSSGRYVIVFNGEIYNHQQIRGDLESRRRDPAKGLTGPRMNWRGHSDTEVMLEAFEEWGVADAVRRFTGMFAFALWDRQERHLHLVRDRMGEKPLYYGWMGNIFLFGSELKALRAHPAWRGEIDRDALGLLLRYSYIPAPYSIYSGILKLEPGAIVTIRAERDGPGLCPAPEPYWSFNEIVLRGLENPFDGTEKEAVDQLDGLLRSAIGRQMVADVPLGAFLSGGVDSSTIVALMQAQADRPIRTFTMGFHEASYNEAEHAGAVARHLRTDHTELYVTPQDALDVIPRLPALYDEPFADPSQIPTFLVAQLTRRHVTVSLSGDAGDELFGGYNRYFLGKSLWRKVGWMPRRLRSLLAAGCTALSPAQWDSLTCVLPRTARLRHAGDKIHKLAEILASETPEAMYRGLVSHWNAEVVRGSRERRTLLSDPSAWAGLPDFMQRMMYLDALTYLADDILVKVDRAAMGVSLETRVPFLDHRVVEFAWTLPVEMKMRNGKGKVILKKLLEKYVPHELTERPKMGFGVPIDSWLRGPLREWAEALLDENRIEREGYLHPAPVRKKWLEHLSGRRNWQYYLWDVLMFQAWLEGTPSCEPKERSR